MTHDCAFTGIIESIPGGYEPQGLSLNLLRLDLSLLWEEHQRVDAALLIRDSARVRCIFAAVL